MIHVERWGDERLLEVVRHLDGVEVRGVPALSPVIAYQVGNTVFDPADVIVVRENPTG